MNANLQPIVEVKRRLIAASIASIFSLAAPLAFAGTTWTVNSCIEGTSGSGVNGSLRYAAANAQSGDVIDLSPLPCSIVSLSTGSIVLPQNDITLIGPGQDQLMLTGRLNGTTQLDRVLQHTGQGTLTIRDLSVAYGQVNSIGGCIHSSGSLSLDHVTVKNCMVGTVDTPKGSGGGIQANNTVSMQYSTITGNSAKSGGGVDAALGLVMRYSTVDHNTASDHGGGVITATQLSIIGSTIDHNHAQSGGGVWINSAYPIFINNSTIANNSADGIVGGLSANYVDAVTIHNSTFASNTAGSASVGGGLYQSPGLAVKASGYYAVPLDVQSSIFANNTYGGGTELDFATGSPAFATFSSSSKANLIQVSREPVPADTLTGACALLGPLRDNGGFTHTVALLSKSPAIDMGLNPDSLDSDQRGPQFGSTAYPRVNNVVTDIGAYELQQNDVIFNVGFDGCPSLPQSG